MRASVVKSIYSTMKLSHWTIIQNMFDCLILITIVAWGVVFHSPLYVHNVHNQFSIGLSILILTDQNSPTACKSKVSDYYFPTSCRSNFLPFISVILSFNMAAVCQVGIFDYNRIWETPAKIPFNEKFNLPSCFSKIQPSTSFLLNSGSVIFDNTKSQSNGVVLTILLLKSI